MALSDSSCQLIAGVDEVGRGPLVGSVVAAAVILDPAKPMTGLRDSKKLSAKRREALCAEIQQHALAYAISSVSAAVIDEINILQASLLAMRQAVMQLNVVPQQVLVDGNACPDLPYAVEAVIKGDQKIAAISAASILAKVTRDHEMFELDKIYPDYGFAQHKGYPTKAHMQALQKYGPLAEHRKSYAPVRRCMIVEV